MSSRSSGKQRGVLKQGLNHANSRIRGHGKVESRIGEAEVGA